MIDLSQDACDRRMLRELRFVTELADSCWDQDIWGLTTTDRAHFYPDEETPCGTRGCLAGWSAIHAGLALPMLNPAPGQMYEDVQYFLEITETGVEMIKTSTITEIDGPGYDATQDFFTLGAILLGLPDRKTALQLFKSNHTLGSLWRSALQLTMGRVQLPSDLIDRVIIVDTARYERSRR